MRNRNEVKRECALKKENAVLLVRLLPSETERIPVVLCLSPGVVLLEEDGLSIERCCKDEEGKVELAVQEETNGA